MKLALDGAQARAVRQILDAELPDTPVAVFGSRATGRARPYSDLDLLVLKPVRLTWAQRARLRDAFEFSDLPFRVDIVEEGELSAAVADRVRKERRPLP
jgi:predicted nucleotidyltransferase